MADTATVTPATASRIQAELADRLKATLLDYFPTANDASGDGPNRAALTIPMPEVITSGRDAQDTVRAIVELSKPADQFTCSPDEFVAHVARVLSVRMTIQAAKDETHPDHEAASRMQLSAPDGRSLSFGVVLDALFNKRAMTSLAKLCVGLKAK